MKFFMSSFTFNNLSQKCSDERKFGKETLQYLYRKCQRMEEIIDVVVEEIDVCHERFPDDSLSKFNPI